MNVVCVYITSFRVLLSPIGVILQTIDMYNVPIIAKSINKSAKNRLLQKCTKILFWFFYKIRLLYNRHLSTIDWNIVSFHIDFLRYSTVFICFSIIAYNDA